MLHEALLALVLLYGSEIMIWREKERSRIRVMQMNNLRGLLGIRRLDRIPNVWIKELCGVVKKVDERIKETILRWFGRIERRENDRITKRVYVGVCW